MTILKSFDKRVLAGLQAKVKQAREQLMLFKADCKTCRSITDAHVREFNGPVYVYGLGFRNEARGVYCPKCGRCIWAKD